MINATWPPLDIGALVGALAEYPGLGDVRGVDWHSVRPFAASGIVDCAGGAVFVKRHDVRVRSVVDLAEEHAFIAHVRARGCAVPVVLATRDGATAVAGDDGTYEVHALAAGEDRYRDAPSWTPLGGLDEARQAGAALARLHRAAEGFDAPARRTQLVVAGDWLRRAADPAVALEAWVASDARLRGALADRPWRADFARVLQPLYCASADMGTEPLWAHGDFHASNLLWDSKGVAAVLDFGLCNRGSAVFDLATAIERNAIAWLQLSPDWQDIGHPDIARALIEGYANIAPVPNGLQSVLPVVHVEFALSEVSYFHSVTKNAVYAEMAYTDFLLGHALWFTARHGRRYLAEIA